MFRVIHPNRWFFWTIAFLVATGLVLFYFIQISSQEFDQQARELAQVTVNWKTFRSQGLGFSIKYPPGWQIEVNPAENNTIYLENPANFNENVSVSVVKPSLESVIRASLDVSREEVVAVDQIPARMLIGADTKDKATSRVVLAKHNGRLYYFAGSAREFEKILATVKFLPPQTSK